MAQCDLHPTLSDFFFKPLTECYPLSDSQHLCHELSDLDYLKIGVERCMSSAKSGNDFLQIRQQHDYALSYLPSQKFSYSQSNTSYFK